MSDRLWPGKDLKLKVIDDVIRWDDAVREPE